MKCVIFDLDGTLLYTLEGLHVSTNYALGVCGYKSRTLDEIRSFVGLGIGKLIERALGDGFDDDTVSKCLEIFRAHYSKHALEYTRAYDGIEDVLKTLKSKGVCLAVNSNKYDAAVKELCKTYFKDTLDIALGESALCPRKPDATGVAMILEKFNCARDSALFVGDSLVDIKTAKNAGIKCISVSWGYCAKDILKLNNEYVVDSADELLKHIRQLLQIDD